jgi:diguanylate cyclase (GGDEF)-like protein/PAS domain S-box-containing protein
MLTPLVLGWVRIVHPTAVPWAVFAIGVITMWAWLPVRWSALGTGISAVVWWLVVALVLHHDAKAWLGAASLTMIGAVAPVARRYQPSRWAVWSALYAVTVVAVLAVSRMNGDSGLDGVNTGVVAVFAGVYTFGQAERSKVWALSRRQALEDALTGALTRYGAAEWLAAHGTESGVVVAVDLDDFKWFNDTWGHGAGDAVLEQAVVRMRRVLRSSDALVRSGGDEFVIWAPHVSLADGQTFAERVHHAVTGELMAVRDQVTTVGCSLGWAVGPLNIQTAEAADQALLTAKRHGKNQVVGPDSVTDSDPSSPFLSTHLLTTVVDALWADWPEAAVLTSVEGRILTCNAAYENLTGRDRQTLRFQKPGVNSAGHTPDSVYATLWSRLIRQQPWRGLLLNQRPDGTRWWVDEVVAPVRLGTRVLGYWARARDPLNPNSESALWPTVDWDAITLTAVFQPIVHIHDRSVWGYEALVRGDLDDMAISPLDLFALAESTGSIVDLDRRALMAVKDALDSVDWPTDALLSVNMRLETLTDATWVSDWIKTLPVIANHLVVEISERDRLSEAFPVWDDVRKVVPEAAFAVDDWGAGENEVGRLFELHPEWIKIDREWLCAARRKSSAQTLLAAFSGWARDQGSRLILEGVESAADIDLAKTCGIEMGQGFIWGKPTAWSPAIGLHP